MYRQNSYNGEIAFDGNNMELTVFVEEGDALNFLVNTTTCAVKFMGLEKLHQTKNMPETYLPIILFSFLNELGPTFSLEEYNETKDICTITRVVGKSSITLDVENTGEISEYVFYIK